MKMRLSWWYLATRGSILMAVILHAGINAALNYYPLHKGDIEPFLPFTLAAFFAALLLIFFSPFLKPGRKGKSPRDHESDAMNFEEKA